MISSALLTTKTSFRHVETPATYLPKIHRGPRPQPSSTLKPQRVHVDMVAEAKRVAAMDHVALKHPNYAKASVHTEAMPTVTLDVLANVDIEPPGRSGILLGDRATVHGGIPVTSHGNKPFTDGVKFADIGHQLTAGHGASNKQIYSRHAMPMGPPAVPESVMPGSRITPAGTGIVYSAPDGVRRASHRSSLGAAKYLSDNAIATGHSAPSVLSRNTVKRPDHVKTSIAMLRRPNTSRVSAPSDSNRIGQATQPHVRAYTQQPTRADAHTMPTTGSVHTDTQRPVVISGGMTTVPMAHGQSFEGRGIMA